MIQEKKNTNKDGKGLSGSDLTVIMGNALFSGMDDTTLKLILEGARIQVHQKGALLFAQDDLADRFYLIMDGWVKVMRQGEDGRETTVGLFTRGETVAEAAIFDTAHYPAAAEVVSDSATLLIVPADVFRQRLMHDTTLCINIIGALSRHLRSFVKKIEQNGKRRSVQRLADFLLERSRSDQGCVTLTLPIEKKLLAERLGMTPETLSRSFAKLKGWGVQTDRKQITIKEPKKLKAFLMQDMNREL